VEVGMNNSRLSSHTNYVLENIFSRISSKEEWYKHEAQYHRVKWFCNIYNHSKYDKREDFLNHMQNDHNTTFEKGEFDSIQDMFRQPSQSTGGTCNLCMRDSKRLRSHVACHLEQIALFALPRANEISGSGKAEHDTESLRNAKKGNGNENIVNGDSRSCKASSESLESDTEQQREYSDLPDLPDDDFETFNIPEAVEQTWDDFTTKFSEAREGKSAEPPRILGSNNTIAPKVQLNERYITVLEYSVSSYSKSKEREAQCKILRRILGTIGVLFSPVSAISLGRLLSIEKQEINQSLVDLHSILDLPKEQTRPLHLHESFRDFLLDKNICIDPNFWVDERRAHLSLAVDCIQLMLSSLDRGICGTTTPGVLLADVKNDQIEEYLPPEIQYACLYWAQHLQKSGSQLRDNERVHQFLKYHFLHWLEVLSWMQKLSDGIIAITILESLVLVSLFNIIRGFANLF
jgi:hypothetical protein